MGRRIFPLFIFSTLLAISTLLTSFHEEDKTITTSSELINSFFDAVDNIKTLRFNMQCNERIKGTLKHYESKAKLQTSPRKIYLSLKGPELLWIQGQNGGDAYVNPGTFPYINLNLDPYGSIMRKDQHHTIHEMGFRYLADIIKEGAIRSGDKMDKYFTFSGEEKFNGRTCYKLSISFPDFSWGPYVVKKGENLITIARKLKVSEYMILTYNNLGWYDDIKEGQTIQVPNAYAKLTLLLLDKELLLPINIKVFDDKGLFETYEYSDLKVNQPIPDVEFSKEFPGYNF
jgi:outer membrane lipoprotein-sorting protein